MKNSILAAAAFLALTPSTQASASVFVVNTGAPTTGTIQLLRPIQSLAGFFTLSEATTINSIEGFITGSPNINTKITVYSNGIVPSAANALFSVDFASASGSFFKGTWQGVFGENRNLAAGSYWVGFAADNGDLGMLGGFDGNVPAPLTNYAFGDQFGRWFSAPLNLGVRIAGTPAVVGQVPEPGTWAMMIFGFGLVGGLMRRRMATVSYA